MGAKMLKIARVSTLAKWWLYIMCTSRLSIRVGRKKQSRQQAGSIRLA